MKKLILASASPRRLELLRQIGVEPVVVVADAMELGKGLPEEVVRSNAIAKAEAVRSFLAAADRQTLLDLAGGEPGLISVDSTILAADTIVALDQMILGKPKDAASARAMLAELSGKTHSVYTGMAAIENGELRSTVIQSRVSFFELTPTAIAAYVATGEPLDKAGAYGIQGKGAVLVRAIAGDYNNIVGLPIAALKNIMRIGDYINW